MFKYTLLYVHKQGIRQITVITRIVSQSDRKQWEENIVLKQLKKSNNNNDIWKENYLIIKIVKFVFFKWFFANSFLVWLESRINLKMYM